jgi:hypothetical protein
MKNMLDNKKLKKKNIINSKIAVAEKLNKF